MIKAPTLSEMETRELSVAELQAVLLNFMQFHNAQARRFEEDLRQIQRNSPSDRDKLLDGESMFK